MTRATEKQINYINDLINGSVGNIEKYGREIFKGEFRQFQFSKRIGDKKMDQFSQEQQKAFFSEMRDQRDQDWTEYTEIIATRLNSINPAEMTVDEASKTIDYLKNREYGRI